jgi:hypothetical protein
MSSSMAPWDLSTARWCFQNFARVAREMGHEGFALDIRRVARRRLTCTSREATRAALLSLYGPGCLRLLMRRVDREMAEQERRLKAPLGPRSPLEQMIDRATGFDQSPLYPRTTGKRGGSLAHDPRPFRR